MPEKQQQKKEEAKQLNLPSRCSHATFPSPSAFAFLQTPDKAAKLAKRAYVSECGVSVWRVRGGCVGCVSTSQEHMCVCEFDATTEKHFLLVSCCLRVVLATVSPPAYLPPSLYRSPSSPTTHTHVAPAMCVFVCVFLSFYGLLTTTSGSESGSCSRSGTGSVSQGNEYINTLLHTYIRRLGHLSPTADNVLCVCVCVGEGGPCRPVVSRRKREREAGTGRVCP